MDTRYNKALAEAEAGGYRPVFELFRDAVSESVAVVSRPLSKVEEMLSSDSGLYATFHHQVEGDARLPENNEWDRARESVESAVFPHYFREIQFGALSLDGSGLPAYGGLALILKDVSIRMRSSVFDQPLFPFFKRHGIVIGRTVPPGYRASWSDRGRLAAAKLGSKLTGDTNVTEFQKILLSDEPVTEADCIEVHVYGPLHRRAIEMVKVKRPKRGPDQTILKSLVRKLEAADVRVEITP